MLRMRLKVKKTRLQLYTTQRPLKYINLRWYWLHELRQLRAKRRVSGTATKKDIKAAQRELVKIRKAYPSE